MPKTTCLLSKYTAKGSKWCDNGTADRTHAHTHTLTTPTHTHSTHTLTTPTHTRAYTRTQHGTPYRRRIVCTKHGHMDTRKHAHTRVHSLSWPSIVVLGARILHAIRKSPPLRTSHVCVVPPSQIVALVRARTTPEVSTTKEDKNTIAATTFMPTALGYHIFVPSAPERAGHAVFSPPDPRGVGTVWLIF